jgi:hypothetical protein
MSFYLAEYVFDFSLIIITLIPILTFYTRWNVPSSNDAAPGGQFTIGGRNTSLFTGSIGFVPLSSQDYWSIQLQSLVAHDSSGSNM